MLRWMAPFMSFTAEEAWAIFAPGRGSIFMQTYWPLATPDAALLAKWAAVRAVRETVNKAIEDLRSAGGVGASLQAEVTLTVPPETHALLASLGDDLKFVFITSAVSLLAGDSLAVAVQAATAPKCERCWHYRADVGVDTGAGAYLGLCGRCVSNLHGTGEVRRIA
jgi:isoleucyl-tRNA synthetase